MGRINFVSLQLDPTGQDRVNAVHDNSKLLRYFIKSASRREYSNTGKTAMHNQAIRGPAGAISR